MTLRRGKLDNRVMDKAVYPNLGRISSKVIVGPGRGLDNAVVSIGRDRRMLITTDPVSIIPSVGMKASAWLSVHLIASDYTTSGLKPEFATFTYNMPREMRSSDVEEYLRFVGRECGNLGLTIVAGHTGSYPGGGFTVVGGGTMFGFCGPEEFVDPTMARPGDVILMTKGAAIEATGMLAQSFPRYVGRIVGRRLCTRAKNMLTQCSTVRDALAASSVGLGRGAVTSMHDATEGGVMGGLAEMAEASKKAFFIEKEKVHVPAECSAVCSAFNIDPLTAVSEGTLLLTCGPASADTLLSRLRRHGILACEIGSVRNGGGVWVSRGGGQAKGFVQAADGYWSAYERSSRAGLR